MNKTQRAGVRAYVEALAASYEEEGVGGFRQALCDQMEQTRGMEIPIIKALIATYGGLPSISKPGSGISGNMRYMLNDAVNAARYKSAVAHHILDSNFMKTWVKNDNPQSPSADLAAFITRMHSHLEPMTQIGNMRKLGDAAITQSIQDDYHGTPIKSDAAIFVEHAKDGAVSLSVLPSGYSRLIGISALAEAWGAKLKEKSEAEYKRDTCFSLSPEQRLYRRKAVRDANNTLIHASADLTDFFTRVSVVPLSPKVVEAIDAAKQVIKPPEGLHLRSQPYIGSGFGGAL